MTRKQVLVIDDEFAISAALSIRIKAAGHEVTFASDGTTGLQAVVTNRPDVILLDIRLPDIDGYEVCTRLKQNPDVAHIPVIFVSANVQEHAKKAAFEAGGIAFINKPFEAKDVLAAIDAACPTSPVNA